MASILSGNQYPSQGTNNQQISQNDLLNQVNAAIQQIMGSSNPTETFKQFVNNNPQAQSALNIVNQYGNGDPKAAFENYARAMGNQTLAQQAKMMFGLN